MSGGVDSAVALLRAGPKAIGVTLRLWLDPAGPDSERACCSPEAVIAARETCHALGLPHVTLDLREEFRRAVVDPFVAGYARGETPNPCGRCNGEFRFAELLEFADRAGAAKLWTGHYARIVERDGRRLLARAADPDKDQSYMLAPLDPALLDRIEFPLGEQTKAETRSRGGRRRARGRGAPREPGGLLPRRRRLPRLPRAPRARADRGRDRRRGRPRARPARRRLALHAGPAPRDRRRRRRAALRAADGRATNTLVVGPRGSLACTTVEVRGVLHAPVERVEAKLRYRSPALPGARDRDGGRIPARPRAARLRRRARPDRRALRRRRGRRLRRGVVRGSRLGCPRAASSRQRGRHRPLRPRRLPPRRRPRPRVHVRAPGRNLRPAFFVDQWNGKRSAARDPQGRRERRQGERAAGQGGSGDGQRS